MDSDHHSVSQPTAAPIQPDDADDRVSPINGVFPFKSQEKCPPSFAHYNDKGLMCYRFFESPVRFELGRARDYGNALFLEAAKEIATEASALWFRDANRPPQLGGRAVAEEIKEYSREEIYELSSEEEMLASFYTEGLLWNFFLFKILLKAGN